MATTTYIHAGPQQRVANHYDFLLALDRHIRASPLGCVQQGYELHIIAQQAGLAVHGYPIAANWTGVLVTLGYLTHGPLGAGDPRPMPQGYWGDADVQRVGDYRLTSAGREEAARLRREERELATDVALGLGLPDLIQPWMTDGQRRAIADPMRALRLALDEGHPSSAVGAAKDLAEAACKVALEGAGHPASFSGSLPSLFKQAFAVVEPTAELDASLGRSLAAAAQALAEMRNTAGAGHGRAAAIEVLDRHGRLAASAACAIACFLLAGHERRRG